MPAQSGFVNFNPEADITSQDGRVIFITGGTNGLGAASVKAFAHHNPEHIYFSGRNAKAAESLIAEIKQSKPTAALTFVEMDLSSLASVKAATKKFTHDRLDVLMCNAGIMAVPPAVSKDGYEIQFATNHLGHAMLIQQLLPVMLMTAKASESDVRIVCLTSDGWQGHPRDGVTFPSIKTSQARFFGSWIRYGQSKLANIVYAAELARRYPSITTVSVHPGVVETGLVTGLTSVRKAFVYGANSLKGIDMMTEERGRMSQLWVAAGAKKFDLVNGGFYRPVGVLSNGKLDSIAKSEEFAKVLWEWTDKVLEGF